MYSDLILLQGKWVWKYASSNPWQQVHVLLQFRTVKAASHKQTRR